MLKTSLSLLKLGNYLCIYALRVSFKVYKLSGTQIIAYSLC